MTNEQIVMELRSLPGAPESLRERVLALPQPAARREWTLPRIEWRRAALVAVPAAVVLAFGGAAVHAVLNGGGDGRVAVEQQRASSGGASSGGARVVHGEVW